MELEIGMYVRTINGKIWIIKSQQAISGHRKDIINASYNIIDLIEVGDFINGSRITEIKSNKNGVLKCMLDSDYEFITTIVNNEIETVVTKEQFENIKYRIGDD